MIKNMYKAKKIENVLTELPRRMCQHIVAFTHTARSDIVLRRNAKEDTVIHG